MNTKSLVILGGVAAALVVAAVCVSSGAKGTGAKLNGKAIFPKLQISEVARVELGDKLKLVGGDGGWKVETYHNYPADRAKLAENLLKLSELKVGQVARGKKLEKPDTLVLKDASGKEVASLPLGEKHAKWGHGRYATFAGETVLVSDSLDAFGKDGKAWVETKIVDTPWISFNDIAEGVSEADLGFKTGVVAKVTIAGDTNRVATIGNFVKGGSDRYLKLDKSDWVYIVPGYSVDSLLPKPPPEKKDEAKKDDAKKPAEKPEATKSEAKKPEAAKPEAKKPEVKKPEVKKPEAKPAAKPAAKVESKPVEAPAAKPAKAAK